MQCNAMQCNAMQCIQPRLLQDWVTLTREESEDAIVAECTARDALNLPSWCLSPYAHAAATLCTLTGIGIAAIRDGHGHGHRDRPETITCTHARLREHACTATQARCTAAAVASSLLPSTPRLARLRRVRVKALLLELASAWPQLSHAFAAAANIVIELNVGGMPLMFTVFGMAHEQAQTPAPLCPFVPQLQDHHPLAGRPRHRRLEHGLRD
jgi:hypothetical protein